jgi:hypothetical protein
MANKTQSSKKKPVSQKRVATVLASLVATLTVSAGALLLMEGGAVGSSPLAAAVGTGELNGDTLAIDALDTTLPLRQGVWDYIIVYESGDLAASSASLADGRMTGGPLVSSNTVRSKANFHFVIDGPRSDGMDGKLEVGTAWLNQESGAPFAGWPDVRYHSFKPYTNAVGICLAADLSRQTLSEAQRQTLIQRVQELQRRLSIPKDHVLFQWEASRLDPRVPVQSPSPAQIAVAEDLRSNLE